MSKIRPERAYAKVSIASFGGINGNADLCSNAAADMRNLRICTDGSLEKRCGWISQFQFNHTVRGIWQGSLKDGYLRFAVAGPTIYRIEDDDTLTSIGTLDASYQPVHFERYGDRLYLLDGTVIRVYDPALEQFAEALGYIPLYGYNWHPTNLGDIKEPLNLLSRKLRVHYLNTTGNTVINLPFFAQSVDRVRVNNKPVIDYSFLTGSDYLTLSSGVIGSTVEVAFTISGENALGQQLLQAADSYLYRDGTREKMLLFGAPEGYRLFCSSGVTTEMLNYCKVFYPNCDPLYVQQNHALTIGDADNPITALATNYDRILAFHTNGAWSVSFSNDDSEILAYPALNDLGCTAKGAALTFGNDIVVVNQSGVCRLHSTASDPDSFAVTNLSEKIAGKLSVGLKESACLYWDPVLQELWVRDTSEPEDGLVWIWNASLKEWYSFDGIFASFFFSLNGKIAFAADHRICVFSSTQYTDNGKAYETYYQSGYLSFAHPEAVKRPLRASLCVKNNRSQLTLTVITENDVRQTQFWGTSAAHPCHLDRRFALGRFRFFSYRLSCTGDTGLRVFMANFFTNL